MALRLLSGSPWKTVRSALTIPPTVNVEWGSVKPGATVMISYVEAGQQKTVKKFEVKS